MKMDFDTFMSVYKDVPKQFRKGQYFFNKLACVRKDLSDMLMEQGLDPFYNDSRLPAAIEFVKENW